MVIRGALRYVILKRLNIRVIEGGYKMVKKNDVDYVWYSYPNKKYTLMKKGEGIFLFDENGNRYFDASGGALVANIGHGVKKNS